LPQKRFFLLRQQQKGNIPLKYKKHSQKKKKLAEKEPIAGSNLIKLFNHNLPLAAVS
jgi:hypothetical protein